MQSSNILFEIRSAHFQNYFYKAQISGFLYCKTERQSVSFFHFSADIPYFKKIDRELIDIFNAA